MVNCGKGEGAHVPAQYAGKIFFHRMGLPTVMRKNQPLVPWSNFGGKAYARTAFWLPSNIAGSRARGGGVGMSFDAFCLWCNYVLVKGVVGPFKCLSGAKTFFVRVGGVWYEMGGFGWFFFGTKRVFL